MPIYYLAFIILWSTPGYTTKSYTPSSTKALSNKQIDHTHLLFSDISHLYLSERFSDVVLVVDGEKLHAHRFILALNSVYFRALFYGSLKETKDDDVVINETPVTLFKIVLKFFYTGRIHLKDIEVKEVFELLELTDFFDTLNLNRLLHDYLKRSIEIGNVCWILSMARLYEYKELEGKSLHFIKKNAAKVMREGDFQHFTYEDFQELINRVAFHTNELDIFLAVCRWIQCNQDELHRDTKVKVLSSVINPLMYDYLLSEAKNTPLIGSDIIIDALNLSFNLSGEEPLYRGQLKPNDNLVKNAKQFPVNDRDDRGTNMIKLENPSIINYIEIIIWFNIGQKFDEKRSYSYYIEVSMDGYNWTRVVDYSNYNCRSRQYLWIYPQAVWYIRFVGANRNANATFYIDKVCYDTKNNHMLEIDNGLVVPKAKFNVAKSYHYKGAIVIKGESSVMKQTFLNKSYKDNKRNGVYTYHLLQSGSIVVHLAQPYILSSMRMLLWGGDDQTYKYKVESSVDGQNWKMIVDKSKELARSWQVLQFERTTILYIRITGVYSSSNNEFRCVYFETPSQVTSDSNVVVEFMRKCYDRIIGSSSNG